VAEFDFDSARRWTRLDPQKTLARRGDEELPFVNASLIGGQGLLLDTCVYIDSFNSFQRGGRCFTAGNEVDAVTGSPGVTHSVPGAAIAPLKAPITCDKQACRLGNTAPPPGADDGIRAEGLISDEKRS
jgi:hypothetical protein